MLCLLAAATPRVVLADLNSRVTLNIDPQELASAILLFSEQSGVQVSSPGRLLENRRSPGVVGTLPAQVALEALLRGTHLGYRVFDPNTVAIREDADERGDVAALDRATAESGSPVRPAAAAVTGNSITELDTVTVTASKLRSMEQFTPTASRLGLSAREMPATLDTVDSDQIIGRGLHSVELAVDTLPGVMSGGSPGDPAELSMRGFTGNQITVLFNGLYIGPSNFVNRPGNSFNLASVEILKGPASVLYGQGAIGGVVNAVSKGPSFGASQTEWLLSYGSFGSTDIGVGGGTHFGDTVAVRADVSRTSTNGYVRDAKADSLNGTVSLLWRPVSQVDVQLAFDYLTDHPSPYWGTPLVPVAFATHPLSGAVSSSGGLTLDQRMRYINYDIGDEQIHAAQYWPKLLVKWSPNEHLTLENHAYYLKATREWRNAETYSFEASTARVERDRSFVLHHQELLGDQGSLSYSGPLWGMASKVVVGFDYNHLSFQRWRAFGTGDSVDPFNPARGSYGPLVEAFSPTYWRDAAVFFEDVVDVTRQLKLVTGGRYDNFFLDRLNYTAGGTFDASSSFERTYEFFAGRIGVVYDVTPDLSPYVSLTSGQDTGGSGIFVVNADERAGLSTSYQVEVGLKGNTPSGGADFTVAGYHIRRTNMVTQLTGDTFASIGSQTSKGVEASGDIKLLPNWTVSANGAYTDSVYGTFVDPATGMDASGQQPPNVPRWTANVWSSVRNIGGWPLEAGCGGRLIGARYGDQLNMLQLRPYVLLDLYVSYGLTRNVLVSGRLKNALNQTYVNWADTFYPSQVMLGAPRSYELSLFARY